MVEPIYIIIIALGSAFFLGLFRNAGFRVQAALTLTALLAMTAISAQWAWALLFSGAADFQIFTAGMRPPFSINLLMGRPEAVLTLLVNVSVLLSTLFLTRWRKIVSVYMFMLVLVFTMGLNGIILTRDLFNLFVFIEIVSIATAGLIVLRGDIDQLSAGFKYIIAGAIASGMLLLGIIFNYYITGSLNMDIIAETLNPLLISTGFAGLFLVFIGIMIELKPFPVNGWGLDAYQAAHPAVGALISGGSATAMFYAFTKMMAMTGTTFLTAAAVIGMITFLGSNVVALKQTNARRLLGYSSVGQVGLLVLVYSLIHQFSIENGEMILLGLLLSHALGKTLLFWLSGIIGKVNIEDWGIIRKSISLLVPMGIAIFALLGMPPFPSFFAKWELIFSLASQSGYAWMGVLLLGSLLEAVYLMRWFGHAVKNSFNAEDKLELSFATVAPLVVNSLLLVGLGYGFASLSNFQFEINWILVGFVVLLYLLDFLPAKIKTAIAMAGIAYYGYPLIQRTESYRLIFALIFIVGALVTLIPGFGKKGKRRGFYPVAVMMYAGLVGLIEAKDMLFFFFSWEIMTLGSYFLILRGKKSKPHALSYMLFSLAGAYLILAGFALSYSLTGSGSISLDILGQLGTNTNAALVLLLLSVGFMTKTASAGLHVWLPGAHAEAEGDVSPMVSGILLKAGVLGLMMTLIYMGSQSLGFVNIPYVLGWIGVISMLIGNYMAAMQEDAKRMLAYSSIGQLGFILFGLALMSHLGWLVAMTVSVAHFIYKVVLFLAIGGVVARVKTRKLYEMGGLITRMPVTFTMVLISIIALSGVPPLAGFAGKWLVLNAIIEKGWYLQGALLSVSGFMAFLYLFRLIHSIFLGQLKDNHRRVKEAPFFMLVPQVLLISLMMFFSFKPSSLLKPIGEILSKIYPNGALVWTGSLATSATGYWDGAAVMWIFMAIFGVLFVLLFLINRRAQWVKQFNIVYAAERPNRPETTHFGYNFFAPYRRAVGFLEYPLAVRFWNFVTDLFHSIAGFIRLIYTGNGQTYLLQLVIFIVVTFLLTRGGQ